MISAIMFDLDGTLVQSEKLKSLSYAIAVQRLRGLSEPDPRAIEAYREIVGAARDVASRHIMESLGLESDPGPLDGPTWRQRALGGADGHADRDLRRHGG